MRTEIRNLQRRLGITSIYVTHDQEEAMAISDQIIILSDGKVQQKGSQQDIYLNPVNSFVANFIGDSDVLKVSVKDFSEETLTLLIVGTTFKAKNELEHKFQINDIVD